MQHQASECNSYKLSCICCPFTTRWWRELPQHVTLGELSCHQVDLDLRFLQTHDILSSAQSCDLIAREKERHGLVRRQASTFRLKLCPRRPEPAIEHLWTGHLTKVDLIHTMHTREDLQGRFRHHQIMTSKRFSQLVRCTVGSSRRVHCVCSSLMSAHLVWNMIADHSGNKSIVATCLISAGV